MADYQSSFTGQATEAVIRRLLNWAAAGYTSQLPNSSSAEWDTYDNITINSVTYATIWRVAPTNSNQVYGYGMDKNTGRLYQIYNNRGTYVATALDGDTDTVNTTGATPWTWSSGAQLYLVGAPTQGVNPGDGSVTYSDVNVYIGQDDKLYSNNEQVLTQSDLITATNSDIEKLFKEAVSITANVTPLGVGVAMILYTFEGDSQPTPILYHPQYGWLIVLDASTFTFGDVVTPVLYTGDSISGQLIVVPGNDNYALPAEISATNASVQSYNNSTGEFVLSGISGNVIINATLIELS